MFNFHFPDLSAIFEGVLVEFIFTILAVIAAQTLIKWINNWRYGRWKLTVKRTDTIILDKIPVSPQKMKQINDVPEEMSVFLKGLCSPFHYIKCDLSRRGVALGVLTQDYDNREIIIDLDKDKPEFDEPKKISPGM